MPPKYSERFEKAFMWLMPQEVVYEKGFYGNMNHVTWEDVKFDRGALTKFGVDQRSHPRTDIKNLTLEQAKEIYWYEYWLPSMAENLPAGYGEVLFDIKVNGGDGPRLLQAGLNKLGYNLAVDGKIGPRTVGAMNNAGSMGLDKFLDMRQARYESLSRSANRHKFLQGWTNRNNSLRKFVGA